MVSVLPYVALSHSLMPIFPLELTVETSNPFISPSVKNLELKLFVILLSREFFLQTLPDSLADKDEVDVREAVTRRPVEAWVKLQRWTDK